MGRVWNKSDLRSLQVQSRQDRLANIMIELEEAARAMEMSNHWNQRNAAAQEAAVPRGQEEHPEHGEAEGPNLPEDLEHIAAVGEAEMPEGQEAPQELEEVEAPNVPED